MEFCEYCAEPSPGDPPLCAFSLLPEEKRFFLHLILVHSRFDQTREPASPGRSPWRRRPDLVSPANARFRCIPLSSLTSVVPPNRVPNRPFSSTLPSFVLIVRSLSLYRPPSRRSSPLVLISPSFHYLFLSKPYQMAPAAFRTVYSFFALIAIPQVLAGPGCARNHYGKDDCVEKCRSGWGGGNNYMGAFIRSFCRDGWRTQRFFNLKAVTRGEV